MSDDNKEGAWRITESRRYNLSGSEGYIYPKKYLYDNLKAYERQLKSKKTSAKKWVHVLGQNNIKLVSERFDGKRWVQIDEWVGP